MKTFEALYPGKYPVLSSKSSAAGIAALIVCLCFGCSGGVPHENALSRDTLSRYSYLMVGFDKADKRKLNFGTVSFIRKGKKLYLMGAMHELTGVDPYNHQRVCTVPDTLAVIIDNKEVPVGLEIDKRRVENKAVFQGKFVCPDFFFLEIKDPIGVKLNTIERFLPSSGETPEVGDSILSFGYTDKGDSSINVFLKRPPSPLQSTVVKQNSSSNRFYQKQNNGEVHPLVDSVNFISHYAPADPGFGRSGSPVFSFRNGRWRLAGMVVSADVKQHILFVLRYSMIDRYLQSAKA